VRVAAQRRENNDINTLLDVGGVGDDEPEAVVVKLIV